LNVRNQADYQTKKSKNHGDLQTPPAIAESLSAAEEKSHGYKNTWRQPKAQLIDTRGCWHERRALDARYRDTPPGKQ
jgi:hypothetical protein